VLTNCSVLSRCDSRWQTVPRPGCADGGAGFKKPGFLKKGQPRVFLGFIGFWGFIGFLDKHEKIGKIIQKLSNLKP